MKFRIAPTLLAVAVGLLAALPLVDTWRVFGPQFALPAIGYTDANNYLHRLHAIERGDWFFGNPYYVEHATDPSPTVFISDWIASIPLHVGMSLPVALAFNLFLWCGISAALLYWFFRRQSLSETWSSAAALAVFVSTYLFLIRPVSLQVIFPFFLLFLAALFAWKRTPTWSHGVLLAATTAAGPYLYSYLGQLVLATMGVAFLVALVRGQWPRVRQLIGIGAGTIFFLIPFALYAWIQTTHPAYWDMLTRTGLVLTRVPPLQFFVLTAGVLALLALWTIPVWKRWSMRPGYDHARWCTNMVGGGMILAAGSHLITGKELEIAQHIQKFTDPWIILSLALWAWFTRPAWQPLKKQATLTAVCVVCALVALTSPLRALQELAELQTPHAVAARTALFQETSAVQGVLDRLNHFLQPVVIWTKDGTVLNDAMTSATPHRVLFSSRSTMQLTSTEELETRYLVSQSLNNIDQARIEADFRAYAGPSAIHPHKTHNRTVRLCQWLQLPRIGVHCGTPQDAVSFKGRDYFENLFRQYQRIQADPAKYFRTYNVTYVVNDRRNPIAVDRLMEIFSNAAITYDDGRFQIIQLSAPSAPEAPAQEA